MKPEEFTNNSPGQCRMEPAGYYSFIPNPLPPNVKVDWRLASLLSEADRAMGELSGAGQLLPNPYLLIRPYLKKEAIFSSRIENTIADMKELALFEAEPDMTQEHVYVREVSNYVEAMEKGVESLADTPISSRMICNLHGILMRNVRGGEPGKLPGEYRRSQNWMGRGGASLSNAVFVPPPPYEMQQALKDWENYLHADSENGDVLL